MNLNLSPSLHRLGVTHISNIQPQNIRFGDILTHRQILKKVVVACLETAHLLLIDADSRITRIRIRKAANRYYRDLYNIHSLKNVEMAVRKAVLAYENDRRIFAKLGLRISHLTYLNNIFRSIRH